MEHHGYDNGDMSNVKKGNLAKLKVFKRINSYLTLKRGMNKPGNYKTILKPTLAKCLACGKPSKRNSANSFCDCLPQT